MKNSLLFFLFFAINISYSQIDVSKFYIRDSLYTLTKGNVKKIQIIKLAKKSEEDFLDTIIIIDQYCYKNLKPKKRISFYLNFLKPHKVTHFDSLGRIKFGSNSIKQGTYLISFITQRKTLNQTQLINIGITNI